MEEYSGYWDTPLYDDDDFDKSETSLYQIYELCLSPTLYEVFPHVWKLLAINFIFKLGTQTRPLSKYYCHVYSFICGVAVLYFILHSSLVYISIFITFCYVALYTAQYFSVNYWPYCISLLCVTYLTVSEFCFPLPQFWNEIRGLHMIVVMKVISIAFDIKKGTLKALPDPVEYAGYMYCPSNCLFGPWTSLTTYRSVFNCETPILDLNWLKQIILSTLIALIFLTVSNCWAYWLIPQTWRWFVAYQEAFSFRSSHYFISYLSEAAMLTGGFGYTNTKKKKDVGDASWSVTVTRPMEMEWPRSLVQVVVYWNIPMHTWLKTYVFQVCKPIGSFFAVIMTYLFSSLLHGFNLRLAAVLLSLGFYTYIEYKFRHKLSVIFDACIGANPCKKCEHEYKDHVYVRLANAVFGGIAMFHLAYLGCLLENTSDMFENESEVWFLKWQHLDYSSHILTVFLYLVYKLI